jgi:hypothetical protein
MIVAFLRRVVLLLRHRRVVLLLCLCNKFEIPKFGISLLVQFLHGIYGEPTVGAKK